jgi:hypothetical protein
MNTKPIPTRSNLGAIVVGLETIAGAIGVALLNLIAIVWLCCEWALETVQARVEDDFDEGSSYVWFAVVAAGAVVSVVCIADMWPVVIGWLGIDTTACTPVNPCR